MHKRSIDYFWLALRNTADRPAGSRKGGNLQRQAEGGVEIADPIRVEPEMERFREGSVDSQAHRRPEGLVPEGTR
jgi:hypothetical protein